jgi:hypothetical protein
MPVALPDGGLGIGCWVLGSSDGDPVRSSIRGGVCTFTYCRKSAKDCLHRSNWACCIWATVGFGGAATIYFRLATFFSCFVVIPVRVFFPARLRARSAPAIRRCFSLLAGITNLLDIEPPYRAYDSPFLWGSCTPPSEPVGVLSLTLS